ncbi:extracellular solute-binding protein [Streptomyces sp. NPDC047046]|uniref:ABC transporter substrate-binding protein n=1 Tax=Streptomyces sp. NPDC047046 TaxID=3155378 RepID=UPI0033DDD413
MRTPRLVATGAVAGLFALTLSACSGGSGGGSGAGTAADPVTLSFYNDKSGWTDSFKAENKTSVKRGMKLKVVQTPGTDASAYDSFVTQAFRTNEKPDLFTWHTGSQLGDLVKQNMVAETTDLWTEAESKGLVPKGLKDNYTYDGKQYCVPLNVSYWSVYYNKKIFSDNGLEPPKTFADMTHAAEVLKKAGVTPFFQMNTVFEFVWFQNMLAASDPDAYAGLATGKTKFTDPAVVEAAKQWMRMEHEGYFLDAGVRSDPQALLASGKVAMASMGSFFTGQLTALGKKPEKDFGEFAFPNVSPSAGKNQMILETGPLCVTKGAANEKAALDYSKWWLTDEAQKAWTANRGDVSFNPHVKVPDAGMAALVDATGKNEFRVQQRFQEMVPYSVYTRSKEVFGELVSKPPADPTPALEALQKEADAYWSKHK